MIELGKRQELTVVKRVEFGVYLGESQDAGEKDRVLLPAKQVPAGTKEGDRMSVFIYRDSSDRLIATVREPGITLGQVALLKVAQVSRIGAFLDWGLEKICFCPTESRQKESARARKYLLPCILIKAAVCVRP